VEGISEGHELIDTTAAHGDRTGEEARLNRSRLVTAFAALDSVKRSAETVQSRFVQGGCGWTLTGS
jgi:hypothetical protein